MLLPRPYIVVIALQVASSTYVIVFLRVCNHLAGKAFD